MPQAFKPRREEPLRESRIASEVVVDAYNESERALSWYYYLRERLHFPFAAKCHRLEEGSPLRSGGIVETVGLAKAELCMSQVQVKVIIGQRSVAVPLWQLEPMSKDAATMQAVADWHYWVERGYRY